MAKLFANSGDPDQTPHSAASDKGLHCLPIILLWVPNYNGLISIAWFVLHLIILMLHFCSLMNFALSPMFRFISVACFVIALCVLCFQEIFFFF